MTGLKTLEDLINDLHKNEQEEEIQHIAYTQMFLENELKKEAIKAGRHERTEHMNARSFILWFFDITEKDLIIDLADKASKQSEVYRNEVIKQFKKNVGEDLK